MNEFDVSELAIPWGGGGGGGVGGGGAQWQIGNTLTSHL